MKAKLGSSNNISTQRSDSGLPPQLSFKLNFVSWIINTEVVILIKKIAISW